MAGRDSLAKLHTHLSATVKARRLRELGMFDYLNSDAQVREPAVATAAEAFLYLSVNHGEWNRDRDVMLAVVNFLEQETSVLPSQKQLQELSTLLSRGPVDPASVRGWFDRIYRY